MNGMSPRVTVLLPVHNGERHLGLAVESILMQTFTDFELLIIDDGSTDKSLEILRGFRDPRLIIVRSESKQGLVAALNKGVFRARGQYIARMDADDISLPERLSRQVEILDNNPEIGVCGCWWRTIDEGGKVLSEQRLPTGSDECKSWFFLFGEQPLGHPCSMYRTRLVSDMGGYEREFRHAEDFRLWSKLARNSVAMANVPEFLFLYRRHAIQVSELHRDEQRQNHNRALAEFLSESLGTPVNSNDAALLRSRDLRPELVTSPEIIERLVELRLNAIVSFYRGNDLPENVKYGMNLQAISALCANLATTTFPMRPLFGMLYVFARRLNRETFISLSSANRCTFAAMTSALSRFVGSRLLRAVATISGQARACDR